MQQVLDIAVSGIAAGAYKGLEEVHLVGYTPAELNCLKQAVENYKAVMRQQAASESKSGSATGKSHSLPEPGSQAEHEPQGGGGGSGNGVARVPPHQFQKAGLFKTQYVKPTPCMHCVSVRLVGVDNWTSFDFL